MADLLVIVPTRNRPDNIRRLLRAWDHTDAWTDAHMLIAYDADDPHIQGYRDLMASHHGEAGLLYGMEFPEWQPMVRKLNTVALAVAKDGFYSAIGFQGDDHRPGTDRWAADYLAELRKLKTGMVYGNDGFQGANLATEWAVTADAVRALGCMVPAPVEHLYCDDAMMALYGGAGMMRHLPDVVIEHLHPLAGKAATDQQYQRVNSNDQYRRDGAAFETWKTSKLPGQISTLEALKTEREDRWLKERAARPVAAPPDAGDAAE